MIERHVYFRLLDEHKGDREAIAAHSREVLSALPGVVQALVGIPADDHAEAAWDIAITVRFAALADVEGYRVHPDHVRYVEEYMLPRVKVRKAWNFTLPDA